jgi:hypothetical protein
VALDLDGGGTNFVVHDLNLDRRVVVRGFDDTPD